MKKILAIFTALFFVLTINVNSSSAESKELNDFDTSLITPRHFTDEETQKMLNLGFTEESIHTMDEGQYNKYKDLTGEIISIQEKYYESVVDGTGEVQSVSEVSKERAVLGSESLVLEKPLISLLNTCASNANCYTETSWMKMTTVATKLIDGKILLLNNFSWISQPNFTMTDVVAVTHSASAVKIPGTEGFSYTYRDAYGLHSVSELSTTRNSYGIAKTFNLKSFGADAAPYDHTGYVSVQVEKGNTGDTKANAYGHYSHTTARIGTSVSVSIPKAGSINITGQLSKTDMPNTMVLFNY